jgi:hypothetical protein
MYKTLNIRKIKRLYVLIHYFIKHIRKYNINKTTIDIIAGYDTDIIFVIHLAFIEISLMIDDIDLQHTKNIDKYLTIRNIGSYFKILKVYEDLSGFKGF